MQFRVLLFPLSLAFLAGSIGYVIAEDLRQKKRRHQGIEIDVAREKWRADVLGVGFEGKGAAPPQDAKRT